MVAAWLHGHQDRLKNHDSQTTVSIFGAVSRHFVQKLPTQDMRTR
jgi:hypothetical protein